jgi:putative membrane protein
MSPRVYKTLQALILAGFGIFLLEKIWSGNLYWYISNRYWLLTLLAAIGFLLLAQSILPKRRPPVPNAETGTPEHDHEEHEGHVHGKVGPAWGLVIVALPIIMGVIIPAKPLGAAAIANKGVNTSAPLVAASNNNGVQLQIAPQDRNILDWIRAINAASDPNSLKGERANVIGFVYQDSRLGDGQFLVGRFTITCCVADALAIGMAVKWPQAQSLPANTWVQVKGTVEATTVDGQRLPRILAESVETVPEPTDPYIYP